MHKSAQYSIKLAVKEAAIRLPYRLGRAIGSRNPSWLWRSVPDAPPVIDRTPTMSTNAKFGLTGLGLGLGGALLISQLRDREQHQ